MTEEIKNSIDEIAGLLHRIPEVIRFEEASREYENNPELTGLRNRYASLAPEFEEKHKAGTLTDEEMNDMRQMVNSIKTHPAELGYKECKDELSALLRECNHEISSILSIDFAKVAAPSNGCSC